VLPDFGRAVKAISGVDLKPVQIDVIYHVLDKYVHYSLATHCWLAPLGALSNVSVCSSSQRDGNGKLDHNELVEVMAKRCASRDAPSWRGVVSCGTYVVSSRNRVEKGMAHHRDVGVARFVNCLVTCCSRKAL
jgi:hypothetical protein